jgi:outer membrane protein OmpA-like peptidoglycan-associated protein
MKTYYKTLISLTSCLVLMAGVSPSASAATITGATATSTSLIGTSGTNATPITVTSTLQTAGSAKTYIVNLPTGWTFASNPGGSCTGVVTSDLTGSICQAFNWGTSNAGVVLMNSNGAVFSPALTISVLFAADALNVASTRDFTVTYADDSSGRAVDIDTGIATLAGGAATPTPTPTPSVAVTPTVGTAAALAALPKSSTQPKLKFASSDNGLSSASKKSLKKVADVAKDGYGVRVTGAAGMQAGVSEAAVKALAKKRAMEIRAYLIKQGVPKEDIVIKTKVFPIGKAPSTLVKVETLS